MSDKELEEYIKTIEPNFNSHLEKGTIEMSNEYYNLLEERMARFINENQELKKQLDYLRSGEYYNQLRFENEMLQQVVDTNGVPSEVYDYIDCTHRNTELLEENQKYKEVIDKAIEFIEWFRKDNMEFYKNKGVALTISECDGLLKILKGDSNE